MLVRHHQQCLTYFYCTRSVTEPERSQPEQVLRSIVKQMCISPISQERTFPLVAQVYSERKQSYFAKGPLHLEESISLIVQMTNQNLWTHIFIDALDECDPETRHQLVNALSRIVQEASSVIKVFISSRDERDIVPQLRDLPNHYIKASDNTQDIRSFVYHEVERAINGKRLLGGNISENLHSIIINTLIDGAQGM